MIGKLSVAALLGTVLFGGCWCRRPPPDDELPPSARVDKPVEHLPTSSPAARFVDDQLTVDGYPALTLKASYGIAGDVSLGAYGTANWPAGTKAVVGGKEADVANYASATLTEVDAIFGNLPIAEEHADAGAPVMRDKVAFVPTGDLTIRFRNGVELKAPLPKGEVLGFSVADAIMRRAATQKLTFVGESGTPNTVYYLPEKGGPTSAVVGRGSRLSDVDLIAVSTTTTETHPETTCRFNTGSEYPLEVATESVTLVDRRTHETVETKTFAPKKLGCPSYAMGGHAAIGAGREVVFAWIRSVEAKRAPK
ncbi:MAG: hypothetical protein HOO96_10635 [Polyangiaceae bacterium]|nr:hypothetical protein [Polyangiaceae bacterium]